MAGRGNAACVPVFHGKGIMKKIVLPAPPAVRLMNPVTFDTDLLPPKAWVPLGIASLASALRSSGYTVEFHDLHDYDWPGGSAPRSTSRCAPWAWTTTTSACGA